jgi:hypothetical protein
MVSLACTCKARPYNIYPALCIRRAWHIRIWIHYCTLSCRNVFLVQFSRYLLVTWTATQRRWTCFGSRFSQGTFGLYHWRRQQTNACELTSLVASTNRQQHPSRTLFTYEDLGYLMGTFLIKAHNCNGIQWNWFKRSLYGTGSAFRYHGVLEFIDYLC